MKRNLFECQLLSSGVIGTHQGPPIVVNRQAWIYSAAETASASLLSRRHCEEIGGHSWFYNRMAVLDDSARALTWSHSWGERRDDDLLSAQWPTVGIQLP